MLSLCGEMPPDEVVVYTAKMAGSEQFDATLPYPVIRDRARMLLPTRRVGRAVRRTALQHDCERVLFGAAAPLGLLAAGLRRSGVREIVGVTHGHEVWWAKVPGTRQLIRRIGDQTDVLTYVSEYCRRQISPALSVDAAGRMRRLSPTVDTARFRPGLDGSLVRGRWGIGAGRPVVLSAARLVRRKGQDTLIEAWPRVLERHPDAVLLIVGEGPSRRRLGRMVRGLGLGRSVLFVGGVDWGAMPQVYAAADVFALPCRTRRLGLEVEAFGIVFMEAAASGLPVVVGDSGGAPEAVSGAAWHRVVPPRSPAHVADAVLDALVAATTAGEQTEGLTGGTGQALS